LVRIADGTITGAHFLVDPRLFILFLKVENKVLFLKLKIKSFLKVKNKRKLKIK
jgi:hypothetical protein